MYLMSAQIRQNMVIVTVTFEMTVCLDVLVLRLFFPNLVNQLCQMLNLRNICCLSFTNEQDLLGQTAQEYCPFSHAELE